MREIGNLLTNALALAPKTIDLALTVVARFVRALIAILEQVAEIVEAVDEYLSEAFSAD